MCLRSRIKIIFCLICIFILITDLSYCQLQQKEQKLNSSFNTGDKSESGFSYNTAKTLALIFPLNPILLLENKKFYVGITKEFSFGKFPYGRIAAEYSLIFRETHLNQLRFSYNYDIPLESSDMSVFMLSLGGGYFTDFNKEGYFPQVSLFLMLPFNNNIGINTYFKIRNTFVNEDNESDIFDISFGLSAGIYL